MILGFGLWGEKDGRYMKSHFDEVADGINLLLEKCRGPN